MSRPRQSLQSKDHADSSEEDETDSQIEGSSFDSESENSQNDAGSNNELSDVDDSDSDEVEPTSAPLFPGVLSASQTQHTIAILTEKTAEFAHLLTKYEKHLTMAAQYHSRLKRTKKQIFKSRAKIAPINRVPPELLAIIFSFHVGDNQKSPWVLMKVCRAWRATSLLTRALWRGIVLAPSEWRLRSQNIGKRASEGMQVCTEEAHIQGALKRAGSLSLDVKIISVSRSPRAYRYSVGRANLQKARVEDLVKTFVKHLSHSRIRSLSIAVAGFFKLSQDIFVQFPVADLESLTIDVDYPKLTAKVNRESSHLKSLHIPSTSAMLNFTRWPQISDLRVTPLSGTQSDTASFLAAATRITSLTLVGDLLKRPGDDGGPLAMSYLSKLVIDSNEILWPLMCPNLTHLTITPHTETKVPSDRSISLPHLVKLTFISSKGNVAILRAFRAPLLHNLTLRQSTSKGNNAPGVKELWPVQSPHPKGDPSEIEPVILHLLHFGINQKLLAQVLKERLSVEEVITEGVTLDGNFLEGLAPVRNKAGGGKGKGIAQGKRQPSSTSGWNVGCPKLKRLFLDLSWIGLPEERVTAIKESAKVFISQRRIVNAPLESLSIKFNYRRWEEFVEAG